MKKNFFENTQIKVKLISNLVKDFILIFLLLLLLSLSLSYQYHRHCYYF